MHVKVCVYLLFWEHKHCVFTYKQVHTQSCTFWELTARTDTVVPDNLPKMHSVPVQWLGWGQKLDFYLNHKLPDFSPFVIHNIQQAFPKCNDGSYPQSRQQIKRGNVGFLASVIQNRNNPRTNLLVVPCLLCSNWRLRVEIVHIDGFSPSQEMQHQHSGARRPYLKMGESSYKRTSYINQIWETLDSTQPRKICSCSVSVNHSLPLSAMVTVGGLHHQLRASTKYQLPNSNTALFYRLVRMIGTTRHLPANSILLLLIRASKNSWPI